MKKLFALSLILMSTLPALAYVRDDTDTGWGVRWNNYFFCYIIYLDDNRAKEPR